MVPAMASPTPSSQPMVLIVPRREVTTSPIERIASSATVSEPVTSSSTANATGAQMASPLKRPRTSSRCVTIHAKARPQSSRPPQVLTKSVHLSPSHDARLAGAVATKGRSRSCHSSYTSCTSSLVSSSRIVVLKATVTYFSSPSTKPASSSRSNGSSATHAASSGSKAAPVTLPRSAANSTSKQRTVGGSTSRPGTLRQPSESHGAARTSSQSRKYASCAAASDRSKASS
mmetsp:Transcript_24828/g.79414  ORF Transcript_24828/g.79414 Transcript_24828/m.79414 type:complete len:231 (-) Transcript_24828:12-704(-)